MWNLLIKFAESAGGKIFTHNEQLDKNQISRLNKRLWEYYKLPEKKPIGQFGSRDGVEIKVTHPFFKFNKEERPYYRSEIQLEKIEAKEILDDKKENPFFDQAINTGKKIDTEYSDER